MPAPAPAPRKFKVITPEQKRREARQRLLAKLGICCALLCLLCATCWWCLGISSSGGYKAPVQWPQASQLVRNLSAPTMVLFVEPKEAEAASNIQELGRMVSDNQMAAYVVFQENQTEPLLLEQARRLPNTQVVIDRQHRVANQFLTQSAGDCLLYDQTGKLKFNGDLAKARTEANQNLSLLVQPATASPVTTNRHSAAGIQE